MPDEPQSSSRYTRGDLIKKAGVGAGGLIVAGAAAESALGKPIRVVHETAPEANTIKIGFLSPLTGPLGSFGEADPWVVSSFRKPSGGALASPP